MFHVEQFMGNPAVITKTNAQLLLDELKQLDQSLNAAYYDMGRLLYGLRYLHEALGYPSMTALIEEELTCSYATASRYMNTFKHFKRLKYSRKEAIDLITDLSFSNVAPQLAHLKQKKDKPTLAKMIDDEGNCHMTFWMTTAERDEVKEVLKTFDPKNAYHPSFALLALIKAWKKNESIPD